MHSSYAPHAHTVNHPFEHNANGKVITLSNNHRRRCMMKMQTDRSMERIKRINKPMENVE